MWDNSDEGVGVGSDIETELPGVAMGKLAEFSACVDIAVGNPNTGPSGLFHRATSTNTKAAPATTTSIIRIETKVLLLIVHITIRILPIIGFSKRTGWGGSISGPPDSSFQPLNKTQENRAVEYYQYPLPHLHSLLVRIQAIYNPLIRARYYWFPVRHLVIEVIPGQVGRLGTIGIHDVNFPIAIPVGLERDQAAIRRPGW